MAQAQLKQNQSLVGKARKRVAMFPQSHPGVTTDSHATINVGGHIIAVPKSLSPEQMTAIARHYYDNILQGPSVAGDRSEDKFNAAESALAERGQSTPSTNAVRRPKIFDLLASHKVPSGYALVQASNSSLHHVPEARLEEARQIDPKLRVLKQ